MNAFLLIIFMSFILVPTEADHVTSISSESRSELIISQNHKASIYVGRPANQDEVPYIISAHGLFGHGCEATLVEANGLQIGLSSANFITPSRIPNYLLYGGELNLNDNSGFEQARRPWQIVQHDNYSYAHPANDITIIFFEQFTLNDHIKPVALSVQGQILNGGNLTISGCDNNVFSPFYNAELQILEIPLINDKDCREAYQDIYTNQTESPGISAEGYLVGIISMCADSDGPWVQLRESPVVFTKVSNYVDWIYVTVEYYLENMEGPSNGF